MRDIMKLGLLGVRLGILGVYIVIIAIIALAIFPLVYGGIEIDVQEGEDSNFSVSGNKISFRQPVRVYNGGFYDIEDFVFHFYLEDEDGNVISDYTNMPVDIDAGKYTTVMISLDIDLDEIEEETLRNMVFNGTVLEMLVELRTKYMLQLMELEVNYTDEMEWEPLIRDYGIEEWGIYTQYNGSQMEIVAPFFVDASEMLDDEIITLDCTLSNSTAILGADSETITLHQYTQGEFRFRLDENATSWLANHSEELTFTMTLEVAGVDASAIFYYYWNPSYYGLVGVTG